MTVYNPDATGAAPLVLGRYRLGRRLGAGGFGAVYEARDERLDRSVAVKVIPAGGAAPERARREALAAARLEHPGIVALFDAGEDEDARYLVSEIVDGDTLAALQAGDAGREEALSDRDVLRIGLSLCDALAHAHARGVVHRDVKPQNVIVPRRPKTWRGAAKLTDFGVALLAGDEALTVTGDVVGTLAYMAPEQAKGKPVDARADVYSFALVLYESLSGSNPVRGSSPAQTAKRVGGAIPPLAKRRKDLPAPLTAALDRALKANPAARPPLEELGDALEDALLDLPRDDRRALVRRHPLEREPLRLELPPAAARFGHCAALAGLVLAAGGLLAVTEPYPWATAEGTRALPWIIAAACSAALAFLLPRIGWMLALVAVAAGLVFLPVLGNSAAGSGLVGVSGGVLPAPGTLLALTAAALPVPLLLWRRPRAWGVPALAPALAALGLGSVYVALAGTARRGYTRCALGALGAWWVIAIEPLAGERLLLGDPSATASAARADTGPVLVDLTAAVTGGTVALVAVWALFALILPWIVRGWGIWWDGVGATVWAAGLVATGEQVARLAGEPPERGLLTAGIAAAVVAVALAATGQSAGVRSLSADDVD